MKKILVILTTFSLFYFGFQNRDQETINLDWLQESKIEMQKQLTAMYGIAQQERIETGTRQVADFWRIEDGNKAQFEELVITHFAGDQKTLDTMFERYQWLLEKTYGHLHEINLAVRWQTDLDIGPILPFDKIFAGYNPLCTFNR